MLFQKSASSLLILIIILCAPVFVEVQALKDYGVSNYNCSAKSMKPSASVPTNVNSLRPADIKVLMSMGDSLTAGFGAAAKTLTELPMTWPGLSFHGGCAHELTKHVTVPNILRKFNSNLKGCPTTSGTSMSVLDSGLNVAISGAKTIDLVAQAYTLVGLVKANPSINMQQDWKLLTLYIGTNDACQSCITGFSPVTSVEYIANAIKIVQNNLPRTLVSILSIPQLEVIRKLKTRAECQKSASLVKAMCPCLDPIVLDSKNLNKFIADFAKLEKKLETSGQFETKDFTIVVQPFITEILDPPKNNTFWAPDCFHYSKFGNALMSTYVWQNMMQPVGKKAKPASLDTLVALKCPDDSCPFIRTVKNSNNCSQFLTAAKR